jgi:hypothetical protein
MRIFAIGLIAAAGFAFVAPAQADDVRVGVGVGSVGVGVHGDRDRDVRERHVIREHHRDRVTVGLGHTERHCKTVIVHREGMTKKIKKCG